MKSKLSLAVVIIFALLIGTAIAAFLNFSLPQSSTIPESVTYTITIEGAPWSNGQPLSWGTLNPSTAYSKAIAITNTGTVPITISITFPIALPTGWTETLSQNGQTIDVGQTLTGTLTLTVPSTATSGPYNWEMRITATGGT